MKITYIASAGRQDATRASIPLHMAVNGSVEVGHDVSILLLGDAAEVILEDNADTIQGVGVPPMRELLDKAREHDLTVYV